MDIEVFFTPASVTRDSVKDRVAVVIDVLRASTSICTAISNGCRAVIPVASLDGAMNMRENLDRDMVKLCGERLGFKVEGFDLGNSPAEYDEKTVRDHLLIFASTNGSGAIVKSRGADVILVCGFVNLSFVARQIKTYGKDLAIVCAGKESMFALEDSLCAGMLIDHLLSSGKFVLANDAARTAHLLYNTYAESLEATVRGSDHGRYLESLGYGEDITVATTLDDIEVIPVWSEGKLMSLNQLK
jgi:2-phosphosulfolactate phosphatase